MKSMSSSGLHDAHACGLYTEATHTLDDPKRQTHIDKPVPRTRLYDGKHCRPHLEPELLVSRWFFLFLHAAWAQLLSVLSHVQID